jgi:hypothetical protein
MAIYDFDELEQLTREPYMKLRSAPVQSQRERDTMKQIFVDRRNYDLVKEWKSDEFLDLASVDHEGKENVMIAVSFTLQDGEEKEKELAKWYDEEHVDLLRKVPGWRRTRRFVTSYLDVQSGHRTEKEFLALHEYAAENGLGGPEFIAATTTPWCAKIYADVVKSRKRRVYNLSYTFGPAPRDLHSLSDTSTQPWSSTDTLTSTHPAHTASENHHPVISSYITTPDSITLPYTLTGSSSPTAPTLLCINSILTDLSIWTTFTSHFLHLTSSKYRIMCYNARGRSPRPPPPGAPPPHRSLPNHTHNTNQRRPRPPHRPAYPPRAHNRRIPRRRNSP